jgi:hypothetical protein
MDLPWQRVRNRINGREGMVLAVTQDAVRVLWDDAKNVEDVASSILEIVNEVRP